MIHLLELLIAIPAAFAGGYLGYRIGQALERKHWAWRTGQRRKQHAQWLHKSPRRGWVRDTQSDYIPPVGNDC